MLYWRNLTQVDNIPLKSFQVPATPMCKGDRLPELLTASPAVQLVAVQHDVLSTTPDWQTFECTLKLTVENKLVPWRSASSASLMLTQTLDVVDDLPFLVLGREMSIALETHCVVEITCRRHFQSPFFLSN